MIFRIQNLSEVGENEFLIYPAVNSTKELLAYINEAEYLKEKTEKMKVCGNCINNDFDEYCSLYSHKEALQMDHGIKFHHSKCDNWEWDYRED